MAVVLGRKGGGGAGGGGAPSGPAGGSLAGTYPNPTLSVAKQAELDAKVPKSLYDANTVLAATTDDTPAAITMGASTILARLAAGNIKAASVAEIVTLLNAYVVGGTDVAVADGGTGASTAAAARTNLGVISDAILFDSTLGADTASIDTGAAGIAGGYNVLEVFVIAKTDSAGESVGLNMTVNNDTGANYDYEFLAANNLTASAGKQTGGTAWALDTRGSTTASYPSVTSITIPGYAQTTFFKVGEVREALPGSTAINQYYNSFGVGWRSTAAITRMKIAAASGNLKAGSRLLIYGR